MFNNKAKSIWCIWKDGKQYMNSTDEYKWIGSTDVCKWFGLDNRYTLNHTTTDTKSVVLVSVFDKILLVCGCRKWSKF